MTHLLDVQGLTVDFGQGAQTVKAVRGVSFYVDRGETLAIVGESGSGKSATALSLTRLLPEDTARVAGAVHFDGVGDLLGLEESDLRRIRGKRIGMVFQDPMSSLNPVRTIGSQVEETVRRHLRLGHTAAKARAVGLLSSVGIPSPSDQLGRYPHEFSGGMRQRVMIAIALSCHPDLVVADEPTTALDVSIQAQILELLRTLTSKLGTALILISHDLSVVAGIADRVAVMYAGRVAEVGAVDDIYSHPRHPYTRGLLECVPRLDAPLAHRLPAISGAPPDPIQVDPGCAFAARCSFAMDECLKVLPALTPRGDEHFAACLVDDISKSERQTNGAGSRLTGSKEPQAGVDHQVNLSSGAPILKVDELSVHFPFNRGRAFWNRAILRAVEGVSFGLSEGETLGLVGESGSGKSTLGRAILRLERPTSGRVTFEGLDLADLDREALRSTRQRMQLVFQDAYSALDPHMTVADLIAEPMVVHSTVPRSRLHSAVNEILDLVGLPKRSGDRYPHALSGGQRQRVGIARAISLRPRLLIVDEPTSSIDVSMRAQILNLMRNLQGEFGLTYIFISHDLSVIRHMSSRVAVMYLGKIVEIADRDSLYTNPSHPYTAALLSAVALPDPARERARHRLPIRGEIPSPVDPPSGCAFHTRCPFAFDRCRIETPALQTLRSGHQAACFLTQSDPSRSLSNSGEVANQASAQ